MSRCLAVLLASFVLSSCSCGDSGLGGWRFKCSNDADCWEGFSCLGGECAIPSASDSGASDAGVADGGRGDSGTDAGVVDAGVMDAGAGDAGPRDAGSNDAGGDDAGMADAGAGDAGTDAGAPVRLVQESGVVTQNTSPLALSFNASTRAGDLVTVLVTARDELGGLPILPTVSGQGATWQVLADSQQVTLIRAVIVAGMVVSPGTSATLTFSGGQPRVSAVAEEWSGLAGVVVASNATGSVGTSVQPGAATSSGSNQLVLAVGAHNLSAAPTVTPPAPWAALLGTSGVVPELDPVFQIASLTGSFNPGWTWPTSSNNAAAITVLR